MAQLESFRQQFWPHVQPVIAALEQAGDAEHAAWLRRSTALLDPAVALPNRALTTEEKNNCYAAIEFCFNRRLRTLQAAGGGQALQKLYPSLQGREKQAAELVCRGTITEPSHHS